MASNVGNSVPGKEIAAAYSGYSPASPPTAFIFARPVCFGLHVAAIWGLIMVKDAPVSIQGSNGPFGVFEPHRPTVAHLNAGCTYHNAYVRTLLKQCGSRKGKFHTAPSIDQIHGLLCTELLHEELALDSKSL
jgi:hypothetical protein